MLKAKLGGVRGEMLIAFAMRFLTAGISFALNWLVARQFGPHGSGLYAIVMTTSLLFSTLTALGMDIVIVRTISVAKVENNFGVARKAIHHALGVTLTEIVRQEG